MNFMGMGMPEMGVVMLIAFLVLGPSRSIDMARTVGKVVRDLKRTFNEVAAAASLDQKEQLLSRQESSPPEKPEKPEKPDEPDEPDEPNEPDDKEAAPPKGGHE